MIASGGRGSSSPTPDRESAAVRGHSPTRQGACGYVIGKARSVNHGVLVRVDVNEAFEATRGVPRDIVRDRDVVLDRVATRRARKRSRRCATAGSWIGGSSGTDAALRAAGDRVRVT